MSTIVSTILTTIDIFGYSPYLQVNRKKSFKTPFGGFISLAIIPMIVIAIGIFGKEFILKERPVLIIANQYDLTPVSSTNFNDTGFIVAVGLHDMNYSFFYDESYFSVQAGQHKVSRDFINGKYKIKHEYKQIEVVKCKQKKGKLFKEELEYIDSDNLLCLKNGEFILDGYLGQDNWSYFEFSFKECINDTMSEIICKSSDEIKRKLSRGYLGIYYSDYSIQPADFHQPTHLQLRNFFSTFTVKNYHEVWMFFRNFTFKSDIGWLFDTFVYESYIGLDEFRENWSIREAKQENINFNNFTTSSNTFISLKLVIGLNNVIYERLYLKLEMIAANCGGIIKSLLLFGELFTLYLRKLTFKSFIVNYFFNTKSFSFAEDDNLSIIQKNTNAMNNLNDKSKSSKGSGSDKKIDNDDSNSEMKFYNNFVAGRKQQTGNGLEALQALSNIQIEALEQHARVSPGNGRKSFRRRGVMPKDLNLAKLIQGIKLGLIFLNFIINIYKNIF
jgi:hypothetical protein